MFKVLCICLQNESFPNAQRCEFSTFHTYILYLSLAVWGFTCLLWTYWIFRLFILSNSWSLNLFRCLGHLLGRCSPSLMYISLLPWLGVHMIFRKGKLAIPSIFPKGFGATVRSPSSHKNSSLKISRFKFKIDTYVRCLFHPTSNPCLVCRLWYVFVYTLVASLVFLAVDVGQGGVQMVEMRVNSQSSERSSDRSS